MKQLRSTIPAGPTGKAASIFLLALCLGRVEGLEMNAHYISRPAEAEDRAAWLDKIRAHRDEARAHLDRSTYDREETAWASRAFTCHFTFMYDRSFYDPDAGE